MKKATTTALFFLLHSYSFALGKGLQDYDTLISGTGYIIVGEFDFIWMPRELNIKEIEKSFFTCGQDTGGVNMKGFIYEYDFKKLGIPFMVKLSDVDSITKKVVYTRPSEIRVIPVRVKVKYHKDPMITDPTGIFFKRADCIQSAIYRFSDVYIRFVNPD